MTERHERLHKRNHQYRQPHASPEAAMPKFRLDGCGTVGRTVGRTVTVGSGNNNSGESDADSAGWEIGGRSDSNSTATVGSDLMVSGGGGGGLAALKPPAGGAEGEGGGGGRPAEETAAGEQEGSGGDSGLGGGSSLMPSPSSCLP